MTHITHRVSRAIIIADIDRTWCRSMNDQIDLEKGWKNEPLKYIYPTQAHITNSTKWMEILQNHRGEGGVISVADHTQDIL